MCSCPFSRVTRQIHLTLLWENKNKSNPQYKPVAKPRTREGRESWLQFYQENTLKHKNHSARNRNSKRKGVCVARRSWATESPIIQSMTDAAKGYSDAYWGWGWDGSQEGQSKSKPSGENGAGKKFFKRHQYKARTSMNTVYFNSLHGGSQPAPFWSSSLAQLQWISQTLSEFVLIFSVASFLQNLREEKGFHYRSLSLSSMRDDVQ